MKFQLWVYVYQARELPAHDESGMSGKLGDRGLWPELSDPF